jgi:hypothetical protein
MRLFCFFKPLAASNAMMGVFLPLNKAKKTIIKDENVNTRIEGENQKGSESRVSPAVRSLARTGLHLLGEYREDTCPRLYCLSPDCHDPRGSLIRSAHSSSSCF